MPILSDLCGPFACPVCGAASALGDTTLAFRWGGMQATYICGNRVRWWYSAGGELLEPYVDASNRRTLLGPSQMMNYGDPEVRDLVVLQDLGLGWEHRCLACDEPFARVGVVLESGIFVGAVLWTEEVAARHGALDVGVDYFRIVGGDLVRDARFEWPSTKCVDLPSEFELKLK